MIQSRAEATTKTIDESGSEIDRQFIKVRPFIYNFKILFFPKSLFLPLADLLIVLAYFILIFVVAVRGRQTGRSYF
jgi:hypothetical protein